MPPPNDPPAIPPEEARHALALNALYRQVFFRDLVVKTSNFSGVKWLGQPAWQNVLDLWTTQETISEVRPALLVETGTHRGGSALFYAHLLDLLGHGRVLTIDVEKRHALSHPRVDFLQGDSVSEEVVARVGESARASGGPVMVVLDSDHAAGTCCARWSCTARW